MKISKKKKLGYRLYGIMYTVFKCFNRVDHNRSYFIMTHDSSDEGNCGVVKKYIEKHGGKCTSLTRRDTLSASFIFKSAFELSRSAYVFMDNAFLPLAFLKIRKNTSVVQLWHGTGTIKKFGQHVNTGEIKELEARCGSNITDVIVSSEATRELYAECFGVPVERVSVLGLPRTDFFFDEGDIQKARAAFKEKYPCLKDRKLILYAPTFRDEKAFRQEQLQIIAGLVESFVKQLPDNYCLGLRLHPSLTTSLKALSENGSGRIIDFSSHKGLNSLLCATDILITDYSSIIFEYSLLRRPMLFYAYDLDRFEKSDRGFYRSYRDYVPGPVITAADDLISAIKNADTDIVNTDEFLADSFAYTDGRSTERLYSFLTM